MCPESNSSSQPRVNWDGIPALRARWWDVGMATNCVMGCRNRRDVSGGRVKLEAALPYSFLWQRGERSRPVQLSVVLEFSRAHCIYVGKEIHVKFPTLRQLHSSNHWCEPATLVVVLVLRLVRYNDSALSAIKFLSNTNPVFNAVI